ncbi:MAG: hypothetical protein QXM10_08735 [Metallosphaera sp.]
MPGQLDLPLSGDGEPLSSVMTNLMRKLSRSGTPLNSLTVTSNPSSFQRRSSR